jgi:hypothetical protein
MSMPSAFEEVRALLDVDVTFTERPQVVAGDLRSRWRVALLLLLLDRCHGRSATLEQIHVVGWALLDEEGRQQLSAAISGDRLPDAFVVRFDPSWSRAIDLSVGEGLTEWKENTGRLRLTGVGRGVADGIWAMEDAFTGEKEFLRARRISQAMIDRMLERA